MPDHIKNPLSQRDSAAPVVSEGAHRPLGGDVLAVLNGAPPILEEPLEATQVDKGKGGAPVVFSHVILSDLVAPGPDLLVRRRLDVSPGRPQ